MIIKKRVIFLLVTMYIHVLSITTLYSMKKPQIEATVKSIKQHEMHDPNTRSLKRTYTGDAKHAPFKYSDNLAQEPVKKRTRVQ
jgi:hypothetical protein